MSTIQKLYEKIEAAVADVNHLSNGHFIAKHRKSAALKKMLEARSDDALHAKAFDEACKAELKARQACNKGFSNMRKLKEEYALAVSPIKCNQIVDLPTIRDGCSKALIVEVCYSDWDKDPLNVFYFNALPIDAGGNLTERQLEFSDIIPEKLIEANRKIVAEFYASPVGQEVIELHKKLKQ